MTASCSAVSIPATRDDCILSFFLLSAGIPRLAMTAACFAVCWHSATRHDCRLFFFLVHSAPRDVSLCFAVLWNLAFIMLVSMSGRSTCLGVQGSEGGQGGQGAPGVQGGQTGAPGAPRVQAEGVQRGVQAEGVQAEGGEEAPGVQGVQAEGAQGGEGVRGVQGVQAERVQAHGRT
jgi:hypothetical protein